MQSFLIDHLVSRREALCVAGIAGAGLMLGSTRPALARHGKVESLPGGLDYSDPRDNLYAFGKIWAGYGEPVDGWPRSSPRLDTWAAYSQDVEPENEGHPWMPAADEIRRPTGKGALKRG
ncbi:MAG: hypothetical protein AAF552_14220 [Pseudomonadota bacterium]